jgi:hypothetical protein
MTLRRLSFSLTAGAAILLLAATLLSGGTAWPVILLLTGFTFWAFSFWRKSAWAAWTGFALVGAFSLSAFFSLDGQPVNFYLLLLSVLLSLAGYDLADLETRLGLLGESEAEHAGRIRKHYTRLGLVLAGGFLLAVIGFNWEISLSFGWVVGLALLGALGLGSLARALLHRQD